MKKLLFSIAVAIVVLAICHLSLTNLSKNTIFFGHNIEALAIGETGDKYICEWVGSLDCPISNDKVKIYY